MKSPFEITFSQLRGNYPMKSGKSLTVLASAFVGLSASPTVAAYIGPGAGLGVLGILAAVVVAVVLGLVGVVFWPLQVLLRRRKERRKARACDAGEQVATGAARSSGGIEQDTGEHEPLNTGKHDPLNK